MFKKYLTVVILVLLTSCSAFGGKAPKPPECQGAYRVINVIEQKNASFDSTGKVVRCEDGGRNGHQG
jgi:hypothetical protein